MKTGPMSPTQQTGCRQRADRAGSEAKGSGGCSCNVETEEITSWGGVGALCIDFDHFANQMTCQVDNVRGLLDDLAARAVLLPPPLRRRRSIEPVSHNQGCGVAIKQAARFLDDIEIAPVVADRSDDATLLYLSGDIFRRGNVQRERLFNEEGQAGRDDRRFHSHHERRVERRCRWRRGFPSQ